MWLSPQLLSAVCGVRGGARVGTLAKTQPVHNCLTLLSCQVSVWERGQRVRTPAVVCLWSPGVFSLPCGVCQVELDLEKGMEMRKWVLSGILASEETYISQLEALLIVRVLFSPLSQS